MAGASLNGKSGAADSADKKPSKAAAASDFLINLTAGIVLIYYTSSPWDVIKNMSMWERFLFYLSQPGYIASHLLEVFRVFTLILLPLGIISIITARNYIRRVQIEQQRRALQLIYQKISDDLAAAEEQRKAKAEKEIW